MFLLVTSFIAFDDIDGLRTEGEYTLLVLCLMLVALKKSDRRLGGMQSTSAVW